MTRSARIPGSMRSAARRARAVLRGIGAQLVPAFFSRQAAYVRELGPEVWTRRSDLPGVRMNDEKQLELLRSLSARFKPEYDALPRSRTEVPYRYFLGNGELGSVDGEMLYSMIRMLRPRRIIEIGSGNSTYLAAQAVLKNAETETAPGLRQSLCELVAIEPWPNPVLRAGFPGLSRLRVEKAQEVPLEEFQRLEENDILFIDSSHILRIGSDVQYEYLEVLPQLRKGVVVHVHDIFLPAEYHRDWFKADYRYLDWTEQYIFQAFLAFNEAFEVLWAGSYMHLRHPEELSRAFASYDAMKPWPGSFWVRKVR